MGDNSAVQWALIAFVAGAALGYLLGSGTVTVDQLLRPGDLLGQILGGLS